ncbi:hypothetical protein, partial [Aquabacterium soli]
LDSMDSKVVNREIKKYIWPALKAEGFDTFTSRVAWRHTTERIDVIEFQSFNKYNADVIGTTTFSFAVRLGCIPLYIPPQWPLPVKNGVLIPSEAACYFRRSLVCSLHSSLGDKCIWPIDAEGKNLHWSIQDVLNQLPEALSWFQRLSSRHEVLRVLTEEDENMQLLWGMGRNPSPIRSYLTGYAALANGDQELAKANLNEAIESKCFINLFSSVEGAINRAV